MKPVIDSKMLIEAQSSSEEEQLIIPFNRKPYRAGFQQGAMWAQSVVIAEAQKEIDRLQAELATLVAENADLRKRAEEQEARADKNGAALTEINHHVVNATGRVGTPLADDVKNIIAERDRLKAEVERMRSVVESMQSRSIKPLMQAEKISRLHRIAVDTVICAEGWEYHARLLGNVTAEEIRELCYAVIQSEEEKAQAGKEKS